ncbi:unnamed protein product [Prorocentrum cordatum]|uniref:Uncharacterized protein n=1 Tax=Prorocentrum cordatum TaxID=2364126 RepID=A0ABN9X7M2_9DINO|nr:unnamed protein product [Polarella glacialis]
MSASASSSTIPARRFASSTSAGASATPASRRRPQDSASATRSSLLASLASAGSCRSTFLAASLASRGGVAPANAHLLHRAAPTPGRVARPGGAVAAACDSLRRRHSVSGPFQDEPRTIDVVAVFAPRRAVAECRDLRAAPVRGLPAEPPGPGPARCRRLSRCRRPRVWPGGPRRRQPRGAPMWRRRSPWAARRRWRPPANRPQWRPRRLRQRGPAGRALAPRARTLWPRGWGGPPSRRRRAPTSSRCRGWAAAPSLLP